MASFTNSFALFAVISLLAGSVNAQLSANFYASTCPNLQNTVRIAMRQAVAREQRMGASILRLFFHDCFVNVGSFALVFSHSGIFCFMHFSLDGSIICFFNSRSFQCFHICFFPPTKQIQRRAIA